MEMLYVVVLEMFDPEGAYTQILTFKNEIDWELCYNDALSKLRKDRRDKNLMRYTIDMDEVKHGVEYFKF